MSGQELSRWADSAMYRSEPMPEGEPGPRVTLLNATPDPLGSIAALCGIYKGKVVRSLAEVSDDERRQSFADMTATVLSGPLEAVQFHFLLEGFSRALVDQLTRGRAGFYAVESLRFAVKSNWPVEMPVPQSIETDSNRLAWEAATDTIEDCYNALIEKGVPAEDARRLLPIGIATRAHWVVDLRELLSVAGKRLCTQAEFEWRQVFALVVKDLRKWADREDEIEKDRWPGLEVEGDGWQFNLIADQMRPVCYQQGKCGFMAQFDRGCTIRERVEANARAGRPSSEWDKNYAGEGLMSFEGQDAGGIPAIRPDEWAADPTAARRRA